MSSNHSSLDPPPHEDPGKIDLLEKFTRQLSRLSRQAGETEGETGENFQKSIAEVQLTADEILKHFRNIKANLHEEMDESLSPLVAEILDSAIEDTLKVKRILPSKEKLPHSVFEGSWQEQIARWVRMYSDWKNEKEVGQQVMRTLAERIDLLIEKDLQFIESYQKQSLSHFLEDDTTLQNLRNRIQVQLDEPIRKLKSLKKQPKVLSFEELSHWSRSIDKKRSSYLDSVLEKIENIIEEESPFRSQHTDEEVRTEILNECAFLEKEIAYLFELASKIGPQKEEERLFIQERKDELQEYIEELIEQAEEIPEAQGKLIYLLNQLEKFST